MQVGHRVLGGALGRHDHLRRSRYREGRRRVSVRVGPRLLGRHQPVPQALLHAGRRELRRRQVSIRVGAARGLGRVRRRHAQRGLSAQVFQLQVEFGTEQQRKTRHMIQSQPKVIATAESVP